MPNQSRPWYREPSQSWVTKIRGRLHTLASGPKEATRQAAYVAFGSLLASLGRVDTPPGDLGLLALRDLFLDACEADVGKDALASYQQWTGRFCAFVGRGRLASSIIPHDVTRFLQARTKRGKPWSRSTRACAIKRIKRLFRWGKQQGLIAANPLADLPGPGDDQRQCAVPPDQLQKVVDVAAEPLKGYLRFLLATGCRPSEAARLEAAHVDLAAGTATLRGKTTRATGRQRVIYLTDEAIDVIRPLMDVHREGPLFRSLRGKAWFPGSLNDRFETLRKRTGLGSELVPESFRHGFATRAAFRVSPNELAALMGSSVKTIMRYYVHQGQQTAELRAAARRALS